MVRLKDLISCVRRIGTLFMGGYALYLAFGYLSFESPTIMESLGDRSLLVQPVFLIAVIIARIVVYATVIMLNCRRPFGQSRFIVMLCICIATTGYIAIQMTFNFAPFVPLSELALWIVVGGAFFGIGDALLNLLWARFSGTLGLRSTYFFVLANNMISLLVYFVITLLPPGIMLPSGVILFLVSSIFCKCGLTRREPINEEYSATVFKKTVLFLWRPVLGTAILSFMSGLMLQVSQHQNIPLTTFQYTSFITQAVVVVILLLPALFVKKLPSLSAIYKIALPLSAAGFLLLPLIWNGMGGLANACAQLGTLVAGIILWCMMANASRYTKLPTAFLFSCSLVATNLAQLAGTVVGMLNERSMGQGNLTLTAVALVAIYLIAIMSMFLFKDRKQPKGEEYVIALKDQLISDGYMLKKSCELVAVVYRLTPRESEILAYLCQGRTARGIAAILVVSENTIKYHVKSIYQKLSIHSRDEVIDLVQNYNEEDIRSDVGTVEGL